MSDSRSDGEAELKYEAAKKTSTAATLVKQLRDRTGVSMGVCKQALDYTGGDIEHAIERLRVLGELRAQDISNRLTTSGLVTSYIHTGGMLGVMVHVECETDFVARIGDFIAFGQDVAMHVAASNPKFLTLEDARGSKYACQESRLIERTMLADEKMAKKPADMRAKILLAKLEKALREVTLLEQPFIKDSTKTVEQLRTELVQKLGENIRIVHFTRYDVKAGKPPPGHEYCK